MIAALTGRLASKAPTHVTLDVQGVGYDVHIPLSTYYALPDLDHVTSLRIHTHLREDAIHLYGFSTSEEKGAFLLLTGVSGIGPKLALGVLSVLSVTDLVAAIRAGDVEKLETVPGVGKKSAGRLALELRDKVEQLAPPRPHQVGPRGGDGRDVVEDAQSALINLGYRAADVSRVLNRLSGSSAHPSALKDLIRQALKELARG